MYIHLDSVTLIELVELSESAGINGGWTPTDPFKKLDFVANW